MSISQEFRDIGSFTAGRRLPEKSNFSLTCNLLSQYLKEKNNFGDLSFAANSPRDLGKSPAMDLFPQHTGFAEETRSSDMSEIKEAIKPKPKQMTIMYAGKVLVFDDISEEKVKELMGLASNASLVNKPSITGSNLDLNVKSTLVEDQMQRPMITGLPIARKASLHRFLEKRKDRINARSPYQMDNYSTATATATANKTKEIKAEETMAWLGLASPAASGLGL